MPNTFEIIIPSKEELNNLLTIIPKIRDICNYPILIINKSSDKEFLELQNFVSKFENIKLYSQKSDGKGNALREAAILSNSNIIIFFDADGSHNPNDIPFLVHPFELDSEIHHVGGSRMLGGSDELYSDFQHFIRLLGSLTINVLINFKFNVKITDYQNGFRAIKRNIFLDLATKSNHTSIEQEMVSRTLSQGYNYAEVPTHEWSRISGYSKVKLTKHSLSYIVSLFSIMFYRKKNYYIKIKSFNKNWYD